MQYIITYYECPNDLPELRLFLWARWRVAARGITAGAVGLATGEEEAEDTALVGSCPLTTAVLVGSAACAPGWSVGGPVPGVAEGVDEADRPTAPPPFGVLFGVPFWLPLPSGGLSPPSTNTAEPLPMFFLLRTLG